MLTAKEARELSIKAREEKAEKQLEEIGRLIMENIERGEVVYSSSLTKPVINTLNEKGYIVDEVCNFRDGCSTRIIWAKLDL